ncbi:MAG TPA: hypothetical protein PLV68_15710, partial [Ilumatobacteraceae bacterium]|nr:hypothetical protein [Ilumatobacteraceae bacterium]
SMTAVAAATLIATQTVAPTASVAAAVAPTFNGMTPVRLLDTRDSGPLTPLSSRELVVTTAGVPAEAGAVARDKGRGPLRT